jgi:hypothetical protein
MPSAGRDYLQLRATGGVGTLAACLRPRQLGPVRADDAGDICASEITIIRIPLRISVTCRIICNTMQQQRRAARQNDPAAGPVGRVRSRANWLRFQPHMSVAWAR